MKTYKVRTIFTFDGDFLVKAINKNDAKSIVENDCTLVLGELLTPLSSSVDWHFSIVPQKKIKSIKLKQIKNK